jgi:hypothetical protein
VAHVTRGSEVLKVRGDGQERRVVRDDHVDLDGRVGSSGEEGVSSSEAETYGDDLATARKEESLISVHRPAVRQFQVLAPRFVLTSPCHP